MQPSPTSSCRPQSCSPAERLLPSIRAQAARSQQKRRLMASGGGGTLHRSRQNNAAVGSTELQLRTERLRSLFSFNHRTGGSELKAG